VGVLAQLVRASADHMVAEATLLVRDELKAGGWPRNVRSPHRCPRPGRQTDKDRGSRRSPCRRRNDGRAHVHGSIPTAWRLETGEGALTVLGVANGHVSRRGLGVPTTVQSQSDAPACLYTSRGGSGLGGARN
jgi:hypothetical protein